MDHRRLVVVLNLLRCYNGLAHLRQLPTALVGRRAFLEVGAEENVRNGLANRLPQCVLMLHHLRVMAPLSAMHQGLAADSLIPLDELILVLEVTVIHRRLLIGLLLADRCLLGRLGGCGSNVTVFDRVQRLVVDPVHTWNLVVLHLLHGWHGVGATAARPAILDPRIFHQLRDLLPACFHGLTVKQDYDEKVAVLLVGGGEAGAGRVGYARLAAYVAWLAEHEVSIIPYHVPGLDLDARLLSFV